MNEIDNQISRKKLDSAAVIWILSSYVFDVILFFELLKMNGKLIYFIFANFCRISINFNFIMFFFVILFLLFCPPRPKIITLKRLENK